MCAERVGVCVYTPNGRAGSISVIQTRGNLRSVKPKNDQIGRFLCRGMEEEDIVLFRPGVITKDQEKVDQRDLFA